jgi:N-acetylmuramoyl-L-alanine amidase
MFAYGRALTLVFFAAALSGTTLPSAKLHAAPAPEAAAADVELLLSQTLPAQQAPVEAAAPQSEATAPVQPNEQPTEATAAVSPRELQCLTRVMLYEAGAEGRDGMIAVAQVVMNRMKSGRFPKTVCGVVHQPGQFSAIRSYKAPGGARWSRAEALAREVMTGEAAPVVGKALYFHATRVRPAYVRNRTRVAQVGNHIFYR